MCTQPLADGVPPDIASYVFDYIRWAKNVVVIAHFPEAEVMALPKFEGGALFEDAGEFAQIGLNVDPLCKDVNVIWHEAIGMEPE